MVRGWTIAVAIAWLGCGFQPPRGLRPDAGEDAPPASPDAPPPDGPEPAKCMTDPSYGSHGAHRYKLLGQMMDYDTAIDACAADGAHLAVIESDEENAYLQTLIADDAWIGLDDLTVEALFVGGNFTWVTG